MKRIQLLMAIAFFGLAFSGTTDLLAQSRNSEEIATKTKELVAPYIDAKVLQGVAVGIISGEDSQTFGFGTAQLGSNDAPDADTVYEIGSISKVFTGLLLADAIERGLVEADQPAQELFPEGRAMPRLKKEGSRQATLAHLSTHVSGLPRQPDNIDFSINPLNPYADYKSDSVFDFLDKHQLKRTPGTRELYSNLGVGLLGYLISEKQDMSFEKLMTERIAGPLGMKDTSITLSDSQQRRLATPTDGELKKAGNWDFPATLGPAGAIRSTVADMLKFARANLDPPEGEIGKAIELAWAEQRKSMGGGQPSMGYGWFINKGSQTHWHNGGTGGYKTMLMVNREKKLALVVLSNTSSNEVDGLASRIMQMLSGRDIKPPSFHKAMAFDANVAASYVGRYELRKGINIDVAWADDAKSGLTAQLTGQSPLPIYQESKELWFLKVVKAELEFSFEDDKPIAVTLIQGGQRQKAKRVDK